MGGKGRAALPPRTASSGAATACGSSPEGSFPLHEHHGAVCTSTAVFGVCALPARAKGIPGWQRLDGDALLLPHTAKVERPRRAVRDLFPFTLSAFT